MSLKRDRLLLEFICVWHYAYATIALGLDPLGGAVDGEARTVSCRHRSHILCSQFGQVSSPIEKVVLQSWHAPTVTGSIEGWDITGLTFLPFSPVRFVGYRIHSSHPVRLCEQFVHDFSLPNTVLHWWQVYRTRIRVFFSILSIAELSSCRQSRTSRVRPYLS